MADKFLVGRVPPAWSTVCDADPVLRVGVPDGVAEYGLIAVIHPAMAKIDALPVGAQLGTRITGYQPPLGRCARGVVVKLRAQLILEQLQACAMSTDDEKDPPVPADVEGKIPRRVTTFQTQQTTGTDRRSSDQRRIVVGSKAQTAGDDKSINFPVLLAPNEAVEWRQTLCLFWGKLYVHP